MIVLRMPFGLLELDAEGRVVRYGPAHEREPASVREKIVGRNFFTEVAPRPEILQFKARFEHFMANGELVDRFTVEYPSAEGTISVQFLLAHMAQGSSRDLDRLALVRITPIAVPFRS
jgi:photoactive yellow protein